MKKTSKKVVSLLTILSFLLTLVPAAAFAAPADTTPSRDQSFIETEDDTRDVGGTTEVRIGLRTADRAVAEKEGYGVLLWAGDTNASNDTIQFTGTTKETKLKGVYLVDMSAFNEKTGIIKLNATFNKEGTYQLNAAIVPLDAEGNPDVTLDNLSDLGQYRVNEYSDAKVKVRPDESVKSIRVFVDGEEITSSEHPITDKTSKFDAVEIPVTANGLRETKVDVYAYKEDGTLADKGTVVNFDTNSANVMLDKTSDKINHSGKASVKLTGDVYGTYKLYITVGDVDVTMDKVVVDKSDAAYIELTKAPKGALAWNSDFKTKGMEDFVHIQIKDINNNVIKGNLWDNDKKVGEPVFDSGDPDVYVKVLDQPDSMDLDDDQFYIKPVKNNSNKDKDYSTLVSEKELKPGKYSIQLGLKSGKKVVVNFEIAKFGTAKDLKIDYDTESVELDSKVEAPTIVLVDENGVEKKSEKRVTLGYNGYAVVSGSFKDDGSFSVENDEKYLGSKITVTAVAEREGLAAKTELTVAQDGRNIKFLDNKGAVGANNKVLFQLVDGDGKTVALGSDGYDTSAVTIQNVSDDTAKVSATVNNTGDLNDKGTGELSLTSDKPVTADIQVYVRNKDGKYYAGNLKYTFGKTASNADTTVVMTIGSKDVIVDNNITAIDTAALIKNERTFVPYRALAEAFGAKVEWNEKDRTVTTEMDGKKVVMTIDKKEYKVNDKEMTMDVAPYIANDRTLVPVRFVAEALGFKVTPTYNTDGTTASVVFNK